MFRLAISRFRQVSRYATSIGLCDVIACRNMAPNRLRLARGAMMTSRQTLAKRSIISGMNHRSFRSIA